MSGSNKGNHPRHSSKYVCYKAGKPGAGKKSKSAKAKEIAAGKKRAQELAKLNGGR